MPENQQSEAIFLIWFFPAITTILVACRLLSRHLGRNFGWDDTLIMIAWVLDLMESLTGHEMIIWSHAGYHHWDVPKQTVEEKMTALKWSFALQMIYHPLMGAIRASIILFLFRIEDKRRPIRIALKIVFWLNVGYTISTTIANLLTCTPVNYVWDAPATDRMVDGELVPGGECIDTLRFILASCALSIFMDLIIIPIPTAMVWNLTMRRKTKIAVALVMSIGWIATAISVARFVIYYYRWQPGNDDRNYDIGFVISIAEPNVMMWAACAPALKRLATRMVPRLLTTYANGNYETTGEDWTGEDWTGNHARITPPSKASKLSNPWSRKRDSFESAYRMNDLCLDSDSREQIIIKPPPPANTVPISRAWVKDDVSDIDNKPKRGFG